MAKYCYLDFEFKGSKEALLDLVCVSYRLSDKDKTVSTWLHQNEYTNKIVSAAFRAFNDNGYEFVAFNVEAEARAFYSLGLDPLEFTWIDLYLEDRMLCNSNEEIGYRKQILNGKVKTITLNPIEAEDSDSDATLGKPEHNLTAALYRWNKISYDKEFKKDMRFTILNTQHYTQKNKEDIMKYCELDVNDLPKMLKAQQDYMDYKFDKQSILKTYHADRNKRAEYAALTAKMVKTGYPLHRERVTNFIKNLPVMHEEIQTDINNQFDFPVFKKAIGNSKRIQTLEGFTPGMSVDEVEKLLNDQDKTSVAYTKALQMYKDHMQCRQYSMNQVALREWIERSEFAGSWLKTATGQFSLASDAWEKHFSARHTYKQGCLGEQILRYVKFKQSMNGFTINTKKKHILNFTGSDDRVRGYFGIFGAQTSRSQPKATSFIFLKAAWLRGLVHSKSTETFLCGCDYASQEVLIQACLSGDKNLYESYASGDVYLSFAKLAGAVPQDGVRADHKETRNLFKSTFLGISYGMGAKKLSQKLTSDTGVAVTFEKARELIDKFYKAYPTYSEYLDKFMHFYREKKHQHLVDNWLIFGDNPRPTSVRNFPIQGNAAVIMREAVRLCHVENIDVVFTLHDALYVEISEDQIDNFKHCMKQAFINILGTGWSEAIRLDLNAWGDYFISKTLKDKSIKTQVEYIDERSIEEYNKYSKYFKQL